MTNQEENPSNMELSSNIELKHTSLSLPEISPYYFIYQRTISNKNQEIVIFPQLHDQVVFSKLAHILLQKLKPLLVALELPSELEKYFLQAIDRLPISTLIHDGNLKTKSDLTYPPDLSSGYIVHPGEPLFWLAHIARKNGYYIEFIDSWHPYARSSWMLPIDYSSLAVIGWEKFWNSSKSYLIKHLNDSIHTSRSNSMAIKLQDLIYKNESILFSCGAAHWPIVSVLLEKNGFKIKGNDPISIEIKEIISDHLFQNDSKINKIEQKAWYLADIHPHSLHLVTSDLPFMIASMVENPREFDLLETLRDLYFEAEKNYKHQFDDTISPASYKRLFQYLRNLSRMQGRVLPSLFDIIAAAKGMGDDDFAFEVYRMAVTYPFIPDEQNKLELIVKFTPDESKSEIIKFAFKRRFRRPILRKLRKHERFEDFDPIPEEEFPGQWYDIWEKYAKLGMVSYPPEDVFIENYMAFLRKRINDIIMEEQVSSIEFQTSLEDGIDWRATARHFFEGKIYVRKIPRKRLEIGALIIQFLEEPFDEDEYSHYTTLFAEHDQESHISVITTPPGDVMVGPGITRVKYAALISQFPPIGWPVIIPNTNDDLKTRLIYAAMNMALTKIIGFVAPRPPSAMHRHFASINGFRILYLPMSQLTKASMHRLRTMHLLANRSLRDNAREYIGF